MKKSAAIALLVAMFTAGAACAADRPLPAPQLYPAAPVQPVEWTGFYFGVNGGYGWSQGTIDAYFPGSFQGGTTTPFGGPSELSTTVLHSSGKPSGGIAGGQIGFNWQAGMFVFGAEIDGQWSGQQASFAVDCGSSCSAVQTISLKTLATGRARFGLAFDWIMPYVTAGAAMVNVSDDLLLTKGGITGKFQAISGTTLGWTAGAGVDIALTSNWSARLEYLYVRADDYNSGSTSPTPIPNPLGIGFVLESGSFQENIVRVGLNYRFGPRGGPGIVERPVAAPTTYSSAYDFLPSMPLFADKSRSEKRAPAAPMIAETQARAPAAASAPVAIASANSGDFRLPPAAVAASPAASDPKSATPAAVAVEPRTAKSAYKNFDEIEDTDLTGGAQAEAKGAITLPTIKRQRAEDDSPRLKRIMSICSGC